MKNAITICLLMFAFLPAKTQELSVQFGKSISNFQYRDSEGQELENLQKADNFFMSAEYRQNVFKEPLNYKMFMDAGFAINRYGSSGSDVLLDNYYSWDVTYVGINLGLDYVFFRNNNVQFYGKATISPEFLIHGTQDLNSHKFNLVGEEDFDAPILFCRLGVGAQFQISEVSAAFVQYMGGKSYGLKGEPEKLNIICHNIGFGLLFNLIKDPFRIEYRGKQRVPRHR
jgi:hypothetical protein